MSWDTKKAIERLLLGRELTNQLRDLLTKSLTDEAVLVATSVSEDLVIKIQNTFADTLSLFGHGYNYNHDDDLKIITNNTSSSDGRKSEDSTDSIKSTPPTTLKDRRGSYKRRKGVEPVKKIISALIDDGYAWRKYGQKQILNAKHPRSYYRCTHRNEQKCQATKQVQQIEDDPPKYEIIYHGHHICNNTIKASQFIVDDSGTCDDDDNSIIFSFANNNVLSNKQVHRPFLSSFSSVKKESKEEYKPISEISTYNGSSSTSEYVLSPTMDHHHLTTTFDPSVLSGSGDDIFSGVMDSVDLDDFYFSFDGDS